MTLLSATEILENCPEVRKHFSAEQIGYLRHCGLARGRKSKGGQRTLICLEDVLKALEHKKTIQ